MSRVGQWLRIGKAGRGKAHLIVHHYCDGVMVTACGLVRRDFRQRSGAKVCDVCANTDKGRESLGKEAIA